MWAPVTANAESATDALVEHYLRPRPAKYTCPIRAFSGPASHAGSATEPRVTFAAMIGAALLEKVVGPTEWVSEIRSAVLERR